MTRLMDDLIKKQRAWLHTIREETGLTPTEIARRAGISPSTVTRQFKGTANNALSADSMYKIASATKVRIPSVILGGKADTPVAYLKYWVGAGDVVYPLDDYPDNKGEPIEAPILAERDCFALKVRGDSMYPAFEDGDMVYVEEAVDLATASGKTCVVWLEDGRVFLKRLLVKNGSATLISHNAPPIEDVKIERAAPVRWVRKA